MVSYKSPSPLLFSSSHHLELIVFLSHCFSFFLSVLQVFLYFFHLRSSLCFFATLLSTHSGLLFDIQQRVISLFDINMFSATIQKLTVFVLLFGWSIPLGSALLKNVIHSQDITGASVASIAGHLKARASLVDYTEAYNQLMRLLHDIYGDDVSQVLQDPEWLTRVCSQACAPDDQQCHQECAEKQIGYVSYPNFCFQFSFADELII